MAGVVAVVLLPEVDEAKDFLGLLALAQISVGVAERAALGILGQEGKHAGLSSAAHGDVVVLHLRIFPVVRDRMEIEIEGLTAK